MTTNLQLPVVPAVVGAGSVCVSAGCDAQTVVMPAVPVPAVEGFGECSPAVDEHGEAGDAGSDGSVREWLFTFGGGHRHDGRFVRITGTYDSARARMVEVFGPRWGAQYDWQGFDREGLAARLVELPESQWPVPAEHRHVGGAFGGPGENEVECACGLVFGGFDTPAAAMEVLERHIASPEPTEPAPTGPAAPPVVDHDQETARGLAWASVGMAHAVPPPAQQPETVPAGDNSEARPEQREVSAAELTPGMWVATGDPDVPGLEVRHVELAEDGADLVGVVFAGPRYAEYDRGDLLPLVDREVVERAAARARVRAFRAQQVEGLRRLADLAEGDGLFPLPRYTLRLDGGLESTEAVRRFAAAVGAPVVENGYGLHAVWCFGGDEFTPAVRMEVRAAHRLDGGPQAVPVGVGGDR